MRRFFISKEKITYVVVGLIVIYFIFGLPYFLFSIPYFVLFLVLIRKYNIPISEELMQRTGVFFAITSGEVVGVKKNISHFSFGNDLTEIQIKVPLFSEFGIRLPCECEVSEIVAKRPKSFVKSFIGNNFRLPKNYSEILGGQFIKFKNNLGFEFSLQLPRTFFNGHARLWVQMGDRGRLGALFGWYPFRTSLFLYFPANFTILVKQGDFLKAGETPLAGCPLLSE